MKTRTLRHLHLPLLFNHLVALVLISFQSLFRLLAVRSISQLLKLAVRLQYPRNSAHATLTRCSASVAGYPCYSSCKSILEVFIFNLTLSGFVPTHRPSTWFSSYPRRTSSTGPAYTVRYCSSFSLLHFATSIRHGSIHRSQTHQPWPLTRRRRCSRAPASMRKRLRTRHKT